MVNEFIIQDPVIVLNETGDSILQVKALATGTSRVDFADEVSTTAGSLQLNHTTDTFTLEIGGTPVITVNTTDTIIAGDLTVQGTTTTIDSVNLSVSDNIILLNEGEVGAGVLLGAAGIEIDRGAFDNAGWYFNEANDWWGPTGPSGTFGPGIGATQTIGNISTIDSTDATEDVLTLNCVAVKVGVSANNAARPATPVDGMFLYNTTSQLFQGRVNGVWHDFASSAGVEFLPLTGGSLSGDLTMTSSSQIIIEDGTVMDPSIAFGADPDTGLYRPSNNTIGITANGVAQVLISDFTSTVALQGNELTNIADPSDGLGVGDRDYNDNRYLQRDGSNTITGDILPDGDGTRDFGASGTRFATMWGTASSALYADLAERYAADMDLEPGTVVIFGGEAEITQCYKEEDTAVAGVISTNPAYMMNSEAGDDKTHPYVALKGKVPCKVTGKIKKGELIVTSEVKGYGQAAGYAVKPYTAFARALEDFDGYKGVMNVSVL